MGKFIVFALHVLERGLFLLSLLQGTVSGAPLESDKQTLLYFATKLNHFLPLDWNKQSPMCKNWTGVSCSSNIRKATRAGRNRIGVVDMIKDEYGFDHLVLESPRGASARVSLYGGQVRSWRTQRGEELLFTSSKAIYRPPAAVRGGIAVCFPQFGNLGSLDQHGFARNRMWIIDSRPPPLQSTNSTGVLFTDLLFKPSEHELRIWPHSFELRLRVILTVDGNLTLIPRVRNLDSKPFTFTFACHTYFSISDISEIRVEGLETLDYLENLHNGERLTDQGDSLTFESEMDRVYLSTPEPIEVLDHERQRTFKITKEGLPDAVVWNPWKNKSRSIRDLGNEDYRRMLCVDAAAVERPITLRPGEEWTGRVELSMLRRS